jgi:hypothetical protein
VSASECAVKGSPCTSIVSRAARATPTNFKFTSLDTTTGGGVAPGKDNPATGGGFPAGAPDPTASLDAVNGPGKDAAFTVFSDFNPSVNDAPAVNGIGTQDPLDGTTHNAVTNTTSQPFGGFVQHVRPSVAECVPKPLPPSKNDALLQGTRDPVTGLDSVSGFRRSTGERAGPPYIGRGLMEAIPTADLAAMADPNDTQGSNSSLGHYAAAMGCTGDCVAGKINMIPRNFAVHTDASGNVTSITGFVGGEGRFGLRANGVEILQFSIGGLQGELGITSNFNLSKINFPTLFPPTGPITEPAACIAAQTALSNPNAFLSAPISERNFIRNTAPPEFGAGLLKVLEQAANQEASKKKDSEDSDEMRNRQKVGQVRRGAELFGIDVVAFANRMLPDAMPTGGDGLDPHAINQADRKLNCVGCHIPVQRTGQSPAEVGAHNLSFVWAPIFSDLLLHKGPIINAERILKQVNASDTPRPRDPMVVARLDANGNGNGGHMFQTFDLPRNLADDTFSNAKASADGREFRTAPLMGMGRMGPPFLHDARVYLSTLTVNTTPAGTVTTNSKATNAPLVVRTLDDAIRAAIELHDLPAPDDSHTSKQLGGGCPVPATGAASNIDYGSSPADVICPAYDGAVSQTNRSDSREVIRRFRALSPSDQQALIEFLKQL